MSAKASLRQVTSHRVWVSVIIVLGLPILMLTSNLASLAAPLWGISKTSADWIIETVDTAGDYGRNTSLALDSAGFPHIMYWLDNGMYAFKDASGWQTTLFDDNGLDVSLVIGPDDYPRVCYRNHIQADYAYQDASGWHNYFVYGDLLNRTYTSLALDEDGYPHCSIYNDRNDYASLVYAHQDADGWEWEFVPDPDLVHHGSYNSLALDGDGYAHISYYHGTLHELRYAYLDSTGWHIETVDSEGYVGTHTSLALDSSGYGHISYFYCGTTYYPECDTMDLRYAHQDATGWYTETVDAAGEVGTYTSLALDSSGYAHISYHDEGQSDLKYAYQDAGGWHIETVDSEGEVGDYTSLALGKNGCVHISYFDTANHNLKYAFLEGTGPGPLNYVFLPLTINK